MTPIAELLAGLRRLDVHVSLDGDKLRLNAPAGVLDDAHKRELAERKAEIVAFLREAERLSSQQRAIVPLGGSGDRTPIFAVAGHNGDVFAYRALAQELGPEQPFFGLQPPGLEEGSEPLTSVEALARYFASQIRAFRPDGAMAIAGFCAGGTVAFELARELARNGTKITNLLVFGAPYCTTYRPLQQTMARARHFANRSVLHARTVLALPAAERARYLADRARVLVPAETEAISDPVMIRRRAVEEATLGAVRAYSPSPWPGHIDIMVPNDAWKCSPDQPLRWADLATSSEVYTGTDGCESDTMLLPAHAPMFAAFVAAAQARRGQGDIA